MILAFIMIFLAVFAALVVADDYVTTQFTLGQEWSKVEKESDKAGYGYLNDDVIQPVVYNEMLEYMDHNVNAQSPSTVDVDDVLAEGESLLLAGKYDEAINVFDKVLAIEPNNTGALNNKGLVLGSLGRYDEAIVYFDKVLAIDPNNTNALDAKEFVLYLTRQGK